jgi:inner membrane transporter RhtA
MPNARVAESRPVGHSRLDAVPPELLIVVGALSVQSGGALATTLIRQYGAVQVVALRIVLGAAILVAFHGLRVRGASRRALASCVLLGAIMAGMNGLFYVAISHIPLGVAVTIEFSGPLTVAILGSRRWLDLVWVALAAAGIYILAGGRLDAANLAGVAASIGAGACWGAYIVTGRSMARDWPDGRGLTLAMVVAAVLIVPIAVVGSDVKPLLAAPVALAGGVAIALFSTAIPYTAEIAALRRLPAATFGVLMSLEPGIAAGIGFLLLSQALGLRDIAAICCVVVASAGASLSARHFAAAPGELEAT